jgi:hypothetical protein
VQLEPALHTVIWNSSLADIVTCISMMTDSAALAGVTAVVSSTNNDTNTAPMGFIDVIFIPIPPV